MPTKSSDVKDWLVTAIAQLHEERWLQTSFNYKGYRGFHSVYMIFSESWIQEMLQYVTLSREEEPRLCILFVVLLVPQYLQLLALYKV